MLSSLIGDLCAALAVPQKPLVVDTTPWRAEEPEEQHRKMKLLDRRAVEVADRVMGRSVRCRRGPGTVQWACGRKRRRWGRDGLVLDNGLLQTVAAR